jgi:predicted cation transporter
MQPMLKNITIRAVRENTILWLVTNVAVLGFMFSPLINWETAYKFKYYLGRDPAKK